MSLLLDLPEVIIYEILGNWVFHREMQALDTALCNNSANFRNRYHETISSPFFVVETLHLLDYDDLMWTSSKMVKLRHIALNAVDFSSPLKDFCFCSLTESLILIDYSKHMLSANQLYDFINSCPKLKKIDLSQVQSFSDECVLNISTDILNQLNHFKVMNTEKFTSPKPQFYCKPLTKIGLGHLVMNCRSLEHISGNGLFARSDDVRPDVFKEKFGSQMFATALLQFNPNLIELEEVDFLDTDEKFLCGVIILAPKMKSLVVNYLQGSLLEFVAITQLLVDCHDMNYFYATIPNNYCNGGMTYINTKVDNEKLIHFKRTIIRPNGFLNFFDKITNFTEIVITGCGKVVTGHLLELIAFNNPNLVSLKIDHNCIVVDTITTNDFVILLQKCPKLTKLHMHQYNFLSNDDLELMFQKRDDNTPHSCLTDLHLSQHNTLDFTTLKTILSHCPNVTKLCVGLCPALDVNNVTSYLSDNDQEIVVRHYREDTDVESEDSICSGDESPYPSDSEDDDF